MDSTPPPTTDTLHHTNTGSSVEHHKRTATCLATKIEDACTTRSEEVQRQVMGQITNPILWSEQTTATVSSSSTTNSMSSSVSLNGCGV